MNPTNCLIVLKSITNFSKYNSEKAELVIISYNLELENKRAIIKKFLKVKNVHLPLIVPPG